MDDLVLVLEEGRQLSRARSRVGISNHADLMRYLSNLIDRTGAQAEYEVVKYP